MAEEVYVSKHLPHPQNLHSVPIPQTDVGALAPPIQFLNIKSQEASLSVDRIVFGRMPQRSTMTKMSILKNTGHSSIRYNLNNPDWYSEDLNDDSSSVLHVYPSEGVLEPGKQQLLKITVNASAYPRVINKTVAIQLMHPPKEIAAPATSIRRCSLPTTIDNNHGHH